MHELVRPMIPQIGEYGQDLVQLVVQNTRIEYGLWHEGRRIHAMHSGSGRGPSTQERLRAIVEDMVLIAKGEDKLLHLTRLAIQGQHIITGSAGMVGNAG